MQMQPCVCQGRWWQAGREPARAGFEVLVVPCSRAPQLVCFPCGEPHRWGSCSSPGARGSCGKGKAGGKICVLPLAPNHPLPCAVACSTMWLEVQATGVAPCAAGSPSRGAAALTAISSGPTLQHGV